MRRPDDLAAVKEALRVMLPELRARYGLSYLGVFGSWARGEQKPGSDLDLLVDLDRPPAGLGRDRAREEARDRRGPRPRRRLKPFIGARILREAQAV